MYKVSCEIHFCYCHRLLGYVGKCRHIHGHNCKVVVTVSTEKLSNVGMVVDFSEIQQLIGSWISENLDHSAILHKDDPLVPILLELGEPVYPLVHNPTAENIARLLFAVAVDKGFLPTEVRVFETADCYVSYSR
jgi:6-pyruvoyltetrahydropterin/6-carboxytetrahydropterin synthase